MVKEVKVSKRRIFKSGDSIVVTLPVDWVKENGLQPGDEVVVVYNRSTLKILAPEE